MVQPRGGMATRATRAARIAAVVVACVVCAAQCFGTASAASDVVTLTSANFDKLVLQSSDYWLVEFYAVRVCARVCVCARSCVCACACERVHAVHGGHGGHGTRRVVGAPRVGWLGHGWGGALA